MEDQNFPTIFELPTEVYESGSVEDLKRKIPKAVTDTILAYYGLTWEKLEAEKISFTFYPDGGLALGNTRQRNCNCSDCSVKRPPISVNVDIDKINYLSDDSTPYETLAHEFGHVADILAGRLVTTWDDNGKATITYNGVAHLPSELKETNFPSSKQAFAKYRSLPWEAYANTSAAAIVAQLERAGNYGDGGRDLKNDPPSDAAREAVYRASKRSIRSLIDLISGSRAA